MTRKLFSAPDAFAQLPLLELLPTFKGVPQLISNRSALFARYERVMGLRKTTQGGRSAQKAFFAEEAMLRTVLDWLSSEGEK